MTKTAREVVAEYIKSKRETDKPKHQREVVERRTREVVDELPDGFSAKDVRVCVAAVTEGDPELDGMSASRRARQVGKTLNDMVADDALKLEGELYSHRPLTAATPIR